MAQCRLDPTPDTCLADTASPSEHLPGLEWPDNGSNPPLWKGRDPFKEGLATGQRQRTQKSGPCSILAKGHRIMTQGSLTLEYVHFNHVPTVGPVSDLVLQGVCSLLNTNTE